MPRQIDWSRYAEIAYVNFGWSPAEFWRATPADFWCAYRAWQKVRLGISGDILPLGRGELNDLISRQERI